MIAFLKEDKNTIHYKKIAAGIQEIRPISFATLSIDGEVLGRYAPSANQFV
jgi:hypothetical protein